jgi:hypothetical protein
MAILDDATVISLQTEVATFLRNNYLLVLLAGPFNNMGLEMLSSMFGGLGAGGLGAAPNRSNG